MCELGRLRPFFFMPLVTNRHCTAGVTKKPKTR
nr:MAG TPA: hypothetical protein [Caudoviricetes sp.]